ncbi:MAG: C40 family peptidase [Clostridia bacterium]|nr:C40 family peptidase [Clostridia bacterium]
MKKLLSVMLALLILTGSFAVFPFGANADDAQPKGETLPAAEIKAYNLIVEEDSVYISYAVSFENASDCETGLLVWSSPRDVYEYGSSDYVLSPAAKSPTSATFELRELTSKQMTDTFYSVAYVKKGESYYYSTPKKYSVLQYAYNKLGKTGAAATADPKLADYLESMLKYGGKSQAYDNYHTERLASDEFYQITTDNSLLPDGFTNGLYTAGTELALKYAGTQTTGRISWEDSEGSPVCVKSLSDADNGVTVTVGTRNENFSAKPYYKIVFIGDSRVARYNMPDLIARFARADGINILGIPATNYLNVSQTYNIYALCDSSNDYKSISNSTVLNALSDETPADYICCFTGNDFTLCYSSSATREKKALQTFKKELLKQNPNGKIILVSSYGFQDGSSWFDSDFGDTSTSAANKKYVSTSAAPHRLRSEHNAAIKTNTKALNNYVGNFCTVPYVGDGFEYYYDNYYQTCGIDLYDDSLRHPSPAGSYLTAAIIYATVFGNTPCGSDVYGKLSKEDALLLQKVAHEFVFQEDAPEDLPEKVSDLFIMPDSTPCPYKTNEVYHANYKYLLETALSYRSHGQYIEYDQYALNPYVLGNIVYRRDHTTAPENATPQRTVHLDCSGFVYSVYYQAFGYNFKRPNGSGSNQTSDMMNVTSCCVFDSGTYFNYKKDTPTDATLEEVRQTFISTLQPGDAIVYRHKNDWGHTMLYLGNGQFIHCSSGNRFSGSGSDYNFTSRYDLTDIPGDVYYNDITNLINPTQSRYIFNGAYWIKIFRPFDLALTPTSAAKTRVDKLSGISAYKLTSAPEGVTVSPGADVEFTVVVKNYGKAKKTLSVSETLPSGFTYSSGTGSFSFDIAPGEEKTFTYKVRVPSSQAAGTVEFTTYLSGLALTSTPIHVAKCLTEAQRASLRSAALQALTAADDGVAFIKSAYSAIGYAFPYNDAAEVFSDMCSTFDSTNRRRNASDSYMTSNGSYIIDTNKAAEFRTKAWTSTLRAPNVFGGKAFKSASVTDRRIRNLCSYNFMVGDILVVTEDIASLEVYLYLCIGENEFVSIDKGSPVTVSESSAVRVFLDRVWGCDAFFVLRPSKSF